MGNLYVRNSSCRWLLLDEVSTNSDSLMGDFEAHTSSAARQTRYTRRPDGSERLYGGYNVLLLGDWNQLPPIPDSGALCLPPLADAAKDNKSERTRRVQEMFWQVGNDTIRFLGELTIQKRQEDAWLSEVLSQCWNGSLPSGDYFFLMGFRTEHCGSWLSLAGTNSRGSAACASIAVQWKRLAGAGMKWASMVLMVPSTANTDPPATRRPKMPPSISAGART